MKLSEINEFIDSTLLNEAKKVLSEEQETYEVYHLKCDGEPIGSYKTKEEAESEKEKIQGLKPGQELIIDKKTYESYEDMVNQLDEMGQDLEETHDMENTQPMEGNEFTAALMAAKKEGKDKFTVDGKEYDVKECWSKMEEEISEEKSTCNECGAMLNEAGLCMECGIKENKKTKKVLRLKESEMVSLIKKMVTEAMKGQPGSKGVPGLAFTKEAQTGSQKDTNAHLKDVEKKMKDYLSFDGNDNPEFPKPIGKGEKAAINLTSAQEEEVAKNTAGLQNLKYDTEPSDKFKERLEMALNGDTKMGNAATTPKPSIEPSNGADKGTEAKEEIGNVVNSKKAKVKLQKQIKDRAKDMDERVWYNKQQIPVKTTVNESTQLKTTVILNEELEKMKKLSSYNKKTQ